MHKIFQGISTKLMQCRWDCQKTDHSKNSMAGVNCELSYLTSINWPKYLTVNFHMISS